MLEIRGLSVSYGPIVAVRELSLVAEPGRITAILGANGAGKSSVIRAVAGLTASRGDIRLAGHDLKGLEAHQRARLGLGCVLEGRRLFRELTIEENLEVAWRFGPRRSPFATMRDATFGHFPILAEKRAVPAGLLSGGQQQMLIISCTTVRSPECLLLDEPSLGLAPVIVQQVFDFIVETSRRLQTTVVLTEQMAALALRIADFGYVMRQGAMVLNGDRETLLEPLHSRKLTEAYL
ncbi:ABC transporter ATP-binding protein [Bosea sp. (in: a-proteobacteria)]|uniref:ABC transporter ATP-binding protein n=1 Tax=Bosea sp. (in: a-proteobacteria) TaxID=1871050 RepID=UPI003B3A206A